MNKTNKELAVEIVTAIINSHPAQIVNGNLMTGLSSEKICNAIKQIHSTLQEMKPTPTQRVGVSGLLLGNERRRAAGN